jgi:hypothetical protein
MKETPYIIRAGGQKYSDRILEILWGKLFTANILPHYPGQGLRDATDRGSLRKTSLNFEKTHTTKKHTTKKS